MTLKFGYSMSNVETQDLDKTSRAVPRAVVRLVVAGIGLGLVAWLSTAIVFVDETEVVSCWSVRPGRHGNNAHVVDIITMATCHGL